MRLLATLQLDARIQVRNGFYAASAFLIVIMTALLLQIPRENIDVALITPGFVVVNLIVTTFYFVAGLVMLEKSEGVLSGLVVSPLRPAEYLASKALTLT